ncbi:hypothetical protein AB9K34_10435 [Sedimentitalea sp. XS_ASV28]|uniref:hypothetical protein n=1 Tax=Sedimentitalea sp. XS_ASV28 TaxID=3241296 RepID=UPI003515CBE4
MDGKKQDFLATLPGTLIAWGLPIAAMVAVIGVPHPVKTWVWVAGLLWMGAACLWNARRCSRAHCFWTGPFFLLMTLPVLGYGYGLLPLGGEGWKWLGAAIGVGAWGIIALTERDGKYS